MCGPFACACGHVYECPGHEFIVFTLWEQIKITATRTWNWSDCLPFLAGIKKAQKLQLACVTAMKKFWRIPAKKHFRFVSCSWRSLRQSTWTRLTLVLKFQDRVESTSPLTGMMTNYPTIFQMLSHRMRSAREYLLQRTGLSVGAQLVGIWIAICRE